MFRNAVRNNNHLVNVIFLAAPASEADQNYFSGALRPKNSNKNKT